MRFETLKMHSYLKSLLFLPILLFFILPVVSVLPAAGAVIHGITPPALHKQQLEPIGRIVRREIMSGRIPGAVVLIGNRQKVLYRRAFGFRALLPERLTMNVDTIFDMASLTKVVATTIAIMQLVEKGKLDLDEPVSAYWHEFGANGKGTITVRQLLTHYSGLRPDLSLSPTWSGYDSALEIIISERPVFAPGTRFLYSDINFEVLGELVCRISGLPLDEYCKRNIFDPLGMKDTLFRPSKSLCSRIAPTQDKNGKEGPISCGAVHDPSAYLMGGVAGHAGLFSTADDLSIFAKMLLNKGTLDGVEILSPSAVDMMTTPQSPPGKGVPRGLGWEIGAPFCSNRDQLHMFGAYGHRGFTGTEIRIDSVTGTYAIILTNRVHPDGKGDAKQIRRVIADLIARSVGPLSPDQVLSINRGFMGNGSDAKKIDGQGLKGRVQTGIDVLSEERFAPLAGLRVGLITNHSGIDSTGRRTEDLLAHASNLKLLALFSPEHGPSGKIDEPVPFSKEPGTGLPVYSLYGEVKRPTEEMLDGIDALVFDVQDSGVRFYTYITTMGYAMEAAARKRVAFYVLDRPNPITASKVQGPVLDRNRRSFTGYFPLPVRHGMTVGELAEMFNVENRIGADLHVIKMRGYNRADWFDEIGPSMGEPLSKSEEPY